ncbi:MAG: hypothetical protein ACLFQV_14195 [Vulcanimicrobiota bacterium]
MKTSKFFLFTMIVIFLTVSISFAMEGMITRIQDDGKIIINRGITHQTNPGTMFYVSRVSEPIARIKVVQVDDYNSVCDVEELLEGRTIQIGDQISTQPFQVEPEKEENNEPAGEEKELSELEKEKQKAREEYEKNIQENYKNTVEKKTKILRFKKGSGGTIKINAFDAYNLLSTVVLTSAYSSFNVWHGASSAYGIYSSYKSSANPQRIRNVQIEVTLWDTEYLDSFASFYAYRETIEDPRQINTIKNNILKQKGLDKFYVFQIKIVNPGPGAVQFAPFPWHFYMTGPDGKQIKADHYDEILDKALNPNQVVNGYIYFHRYGPNGQPVFSGDKVQIELVDILGNSRKETFN